MAAQLFIRWAKQGVWERLLDLVQQRGIALGMTFIDGTNIRAHQKAAGAKNGEATARSEMCARRLALGVSSKRLTPAVAALRREAALAAATAPKPA